MSKKKVAAPAKSEPKMMNFVWMLIFIGCVSGLAMWGMGLSTSPSVARTTGPQADMVLISGGRFLMGSSRSTFPAEGPEHTVVVGPFWLDRYEVTNAQFAAFVQATGYQTTAERQGWAPQLDPVQQTWIAVPGASWQHPGGPQTSLNGLHNYPVVQVSWEDAAAYAGWAGKRLPSEAEWEFAARSGLPGADFPWGAESHPRGQFLANWWQGPYPSHDLGTDGFRGPAPVGSYPANALGLSDMSGNVWEWCADWFSETAYQSGEEFQPRGPATGQQRVQRGGSWQCAEDGNFGGKVFSRMSATPLQMFPHVGFRCAQNP